MNLADDLTRQKTEGRFPSLFFTVQLCAFDGIDQFLARMNSNLPVNVADVRLGRAERDGESLLDALRASPLGQKNEDFILTFGQIAFFAYGVASFLPGALPDVSTFVVAFETNLGKS